MACSDHTLGASAPSPDPQPARPVPSETVELPRSLVCELMFVCAQLRSRVERLAGQHATAIDRTLCDNARFVCTNTRAALDLDRSRR